MRKMGTFLDAIILTVFIVISHKLLVGRERHPCARTRTHIHTHTHNFNFYPFLYVYRILGLPWAMKGTYGNAAAPPTYPHWEARLIIILTILCQELGSWFCTVVKVLGLSICPWTADYPQWEKFTVGQIQHVLGGAILHLLLHPPLCSGWIATTRSWSSFGPRPAPAQ